ncbi:jg13195, partial [Pararge aegeria aegeria]
MGSTDTGLKLVGEGYAGKRKKRLADKILPQKVRDLVPESQAYMDLLAFERKLDATILRKRLDIQEALKRPMKQKRKLRIFISNTFYPGQGDNAVASWELRVEGRLLDDSKNDPNKVSAPAGEAHPAGEARPAHPARVAGEAQVLVVLQVAGHRAGQGAVRAGQPPGGVAPHAHDAGDGRLP